MALCVRSTVDAVFAKSDPKMSLINRKSHFAPQIVLPDVKILVVCSREQIIVGRFEES